MVGTAFQNKVWSGLTTIPFGQTTTYLEIAEVIGCKSSVRAVASAIGRNPLPLLIPCHRVIRTDGSLGGYAGGLELKKMLLDWERE